jgi:hypothetical protein
MRLEDVAAHLGFPDSSKRVSTPSEALSHATRRAARARLGIESLVRRPYPTTRGWVESALPGTGKSEWCLPPAFVNEVELKTPWPHLPSVLGSWEGTINLRGLSA